MPKEGRSPLNPYHSFPSSLEGSRRIILSSPYWQLPKVGIQEVPKFDRVFFITTSNFVFTSFILVFLLSSFCYSYFRYSFAGTLSRNGMNPQVPAARQFDTDFCFHLQKKLIFHKSHVTLIEQLVQRLSYGMDDLGSNPNGGEISPPPLKKVPIISDVEPISIFCSYQKIFSGDKLAGVWSWPLPSSVQFKTLNPVKIQPSSVQATQ